MTQDEYEEYDSNTQDDFNVEVSALIWALKYLLIENGITTNKEINRLKAIAIRHLDNREAEYKEIKFKKESNMSELKECSNDISGDLFK